MRRILALATAAVLLLAGCGSDDGADSAEDNGETAASDDGYANFADIDTSTNEYFISLEDTDIVATQGEERTWTLGVATCQRLDSGDTIEEEVAYLTGDGTDALATYTNDIITGAVQFICDDHMDALQAYIDAG